MRRGSTNLKTNSSVGGSSRKQNRRQTLNAVHTNSDMASQGAVVRMNSVTTESDLKSVEMAGLDDTQSGKILNESFMSDEMGVERSSHELGAKIIEEEDASPPNQLKANLAEMTPIAEEEELQRMTTGDSSARGTY